MAVPAPCLFIVETDFYCSEMSPPIEPSIQDLNQNSQILGSSMICERNGDETENHIASWEDSSEATFRLRKENKYAFESIDASDSAQDGVHFAGRSAAVWKVGGIYVEMKSRVSRME